jgi:hypothetical protein
MIDNDPFRGLEEWGRDAERRATRAHRGNRLRRALTWPLRLPGRLLRRGGRGRPLLAVLTVLALLLGASWAWSHRRHPGTAAGGHPTVGPPSGLSATSSASAAPTDPFADTPAATFPQGAAGFTMPPATPLDGFTQAQVATALEQVRAVLIAAYLDRNTLVGHRPETLANLLAPDYRAAVRRQFADPASGGVAVLISPRVTLADEPPRVSGRTTVAVGKDEKGRPFLAITTNYVLVYPFQPAGPDGSRLALAHAEVTWAWYRTRVTASGRGLWVRDMRAYYSAIDCTETNKGLLAPYLGPAASPHRTVSARSPQPGDDDPDSYYDPNRSFDIPDDC